MELGFNPKAWVGGPGVNFGFYHTAFGPAAEGVIGFSTFARKSSPELNELADILYTGKPEETNDWWGHPLYWAGLDVWKAAIEKAGTLDQNKIRDVIASEHFDTVLGDTWFENGLLATPGDNQALVQKCFNALTAGGTLIINDFLVDNDRSGPPFSLLFALHMLVHTTAGDTYTLDEVAAWTRSAGFSEGRVAQLTPRSRGWIVRK